MLGFMLNFRYGVNNTTISIINSLISLFALAGLTYFSYKILQLIFIFKEMMHQTNYKSTYGVITKDVKVN